MLDGVIGLYFIALSKSVIPYPYRDSQLIYIGMSEKPSNSIATRLGDHFDGNSGNLGLVNYRVREPLVFTHLNFNAMLSSWSQRVEDLESYFIQDFVARYGVYPICNNRTGFPDFSIEKTSQFEIDWPHFERKS